MALAPEISHLLFGNGDEANLVQETVDLLTNVVMADDDTLWSMVASMQRQLTTHTHAINAAILGVALAKKAGFSDLAALRDIGRGDGSTSGQEKAS